MKQLFSLIVLGATAMLIAAAPLSDAESAAGDSVNANDEAALAEQIKKGATSYRRRCARCHGVNMINPPMGIYDLRTFPVDDKPRFVDAVMNGKGAMPSWSDVLDEEGIEILWVYVIQNR
ncbi:MAG: cytochrome c [Pseudomonadota bacterium]